MARHHSKVVDMGSDVETAVADVAPGTDDVTAGVVDMAVEVADVKTEAAHVGAVHKHLKCWKNQWNRVVQGYAVDALIFHEGRNLQNLVLADLLLPWWRLVVLEGDRQLFLAGRCWNFVRPFFLLLKPFCIFSRRPFHCRMSLKM